MKKIKLPRYIFWIALTGIIFLLLMSLLRWILVIVFKTQSVSNEHLLNAYWMGFRFDVRDAGIIMLLLFLLGSIPALHPFNRKAGKATALWIWGIAIFLFCIFYIVDFAHYAYLRQRLTANVLALLEDTKTSLGVVWQTYHIGWVLLALIVSVFLLLGMVKLTHRYASQKKIVTTKASRITWGIVFFLLLAFCIFGRLNQYPLRWSDAYTLGNDYEANVSLNPFQSFFSTLDFRHSTYDKKAVQQHYEWMANFLDVDKPDSSTLNFQRVVKDSSSITKPNVVLVICESFSMYKSSMINNPLNTTPFFKSMCDKGIFFNRCFTPSYGTARGVWASLTGIPDVSIVKTASRNPAAVDQHSILNDFTGYEKFYFIGGSTSWANIRGLLSNNIRGLHTYEQENFEAKKEDVWGISDKQLFLNANKIIAQQTKPFFAVIQTADNHRPYTIPKEDLAAFKVNNIPKSTLQKYGFADDDEYNAFRYTDFSYQKFIEAAGKEKYFNNTIFVFVGDHGIPGDANDMLPQSFTKNSLTAFHVPLLFYAPALFKPQTYAWPCSQVDVLPTVAGLCKISYTNTTVGRDILKPGNTMHYALNYNPDALKTGFINDSIFYSYLLGTHKAYELASIIDNHTISPDKKTLAQYQFIAEALYETSRYMLLNNKKAK